MAAIKNVFIGLLIILGCACGDTKNRYQLNPDTRIDAVIVDTVTTDIVVIIPEIPVAGSESSLPDDPPADYQAPREEVILSKVTVQTLRDTCRIVYLSQVGVREATGHNDGPEVEKYLKATGLGKGYSWCASFVRWTFDQAGVPTNITAYSPTAHNSISIIWFQDKQVDEVAPADVFTLWYLAKNRIAHTGFIDSDGGNGMVETVEGNTNGGGSRDGDGVYKRKRLKRSLYSITRWIH